MSVPATATPTYPPGQHPDLPPPPGTAGVVGWLRTNLFSSVFNTVLTLVSVWLIYEFVAAAIDWFVLDAVVDAGSRVDCRKQGDGACWAVITVRLDQFVYGFYPEAQRWRPVLTFVLLFRRWRRCCSTVRPSAVNCCGSHWPIPRWAPG